MGPRREIAHALATNLQRLMAAQGLSQAQLSKKADVGQSTLSTLLDTTKPLEINPRAKTIEQLALYFGVSSWQLLIPDIPLDLLLSDRLTALVETYRDVTEEGRAAIDRVAASERRFHFNTSGTSLATPTLVKAMADPDPTEH